MKTLVLKLRVLDDRFDIDYRSVEQALGDERMMYLLDQDDVDCSLWCGNLCVSGRSLTSSAQLRECLISNSATLMRQMQ